MQDIKQRVALTSITASGGLTLAKGVVGLATGSLAILSEAAHSLLDLAATIMTYFAVRVSGRPADAEHHYGHGKVESVTALAETALSIAWRRRLRVRRSKPTRCISAPTCGHPRRSSLALARFSSAFPGPIRLPRSSSRCSSAWPAGGSADA